MCCVYGRVCLNTMSIIDCMYTCKRYMLYCVFIFSCVHTIYNYISSFTSLHVKCYDVFFPLHKADINS